MVDLNSNLEEYKCSHIHICMEMKWQLELYFFCKSKDKKLVSQSHVSGMQLQQKQIWAASGMLLLREGACGYVEFVGCGSHELSISFCSWEKRTL